MARIVLVSDRHDLSRQLTEQLEKRGHAVSPADFMESRFGPLMETRPDLIIVDFAAASREAAAACQRVLARLEMQCSMLGIFGAVDEARGLPALVNAADALAVKEAAPRRGPAAGDYGFMNLDLHRREVLVRGNAIPLTPTETYILSILATRAGSYVSAHALVAEMHGCEVSSREAGDIVRVHIHNLRRKFERVGGPPYIVCARGKGYLLERRSRSTVEQGP